MNQPQDVAPPAAGSRCGRQVRQRTTTYDYVDTQKVGTR